MKRSCFAAVRREVRQHWRRGALIFALLAILANQALLPAMHFAAGPPGMAQHDMAAMASHMAHVGHSPAGGDEHSGIDHQACHFCRLLGAALPPPPDTLLGERIAASVRLVFADHDNTRPPERFATGHRARAPPSLLV